MSRHPARAVVSLRFRARNRTAAIVWPLLVILLPLAGMAGLVWWTLGADRRAVEAEVKARGHELAEAVMNQVRETLEVRLAVRFGFASSGWTAATEPGELSEFSSVEPERRRSFLVMNQELRLVDPQPEVWPPEPAPLPAPESAGLGPARLAAWREANLAMDRGAWAEAAERFDQFASDSQTSGGALTASEAAGNAAARFELHARFNRAVALERLGAIDSAISGFAALVDGAAGRGVDAELTESGLCLVHLAVLKVLELAGDRSDVLPQSWRSHPWRVIEIVARRPPSPLAEACIARLRKLGLERVAGVGDPSRTVEALFEPWDREARARAIYRQALGKGQDRSGFERAPCWIEHQEEPWILWPATLVGGVFEDGHRGFVAMAEGLLLEQAAAAWAREDRRGDFAVRLEIAGRDLPGLSLMRFQDGSQRAAGEAPEPGWAARVYAPAGPITVTAGLADPSGPCPC